MTDPNGQRPQFNGMVYRRGGGHCRVQVDQAGRIIAASAVRCAWSGTERFHNWFVSRYDITRVEYARR